MSSNESPPHLSALDVDELELSVVIPTRDDAQRLCVAVEEMSGYFSSVVDSHEIIVSDDGSADPTVEHVRDMDLADTRLTPSSTSLGLGQATRRGVLAARGRTVLTFDPRSEVPVESFECLDDAATTNGAQVVCATPAPVWPEWCERTVGESVLPVELAARAGRRLVQAHEDMGCGMRLFTREAARSIYWFQRMDGPSHDLEVLMLAERFGFSVHRVPTGPVDASSGLGLDTVTDCARIGLNLVLGRYGRRRPPVPIRTPYPMAWLTDRSDTREGVDSAA